MKKYVVTPNDLRQKARELERQAEAIERKMFEDIGRLIAKNISHLDADLRSSIEGILGGRNVSR